MVCAWLILFCPPHSSRVLSGVGLVGGNPTMNALRLRGGIGYLLLQVLFLLVVVVLLLYILFVTQLPSWSDELYFLFGVFLPP